MGDHRKVNAKLLHVLNPRVCQESVITYMKCLFLNSELLSGDERFRFLSDKYWQGQVIREGRRITLGSNPFLMAWRVSDLTIERDEANSMEVFRWTQVPGSRYNSRTRKVELLGEPRPRQESLPMR
jgi:hypothetical protein